jgi:hypothetical protein
VKKILLDGRAKRRKHPRLAQRALALALPGLIGQAWGTPLELGGANQHYGSKVYFSVRDYGAKGNGRTLDTRAINKAISACAAAGGGQVIFPPGKYLSGTVQLCSGLTLLLEAGATLVGSTNLDHYQRFSPPAGTPESKFNPTWHRALLLGEDLENVTIAGPGVINGNKVYDPKGEENMRGPHTILLGNCRQIFFRDFTVQDSANYAFLLENCQQADFRNLKITGGWDGIHFRGWPGRPCRDVTIIGCQLYTGDDAIAGRYWENVLISDCTLNSSCNGIRLIGPATHLLIHDCLLYGPGVHPHRSSKRNNMLAGLCLQPGAWDATKGNLDDVLVSNLTMHNVTTPFHFALKPGNTAGKISVSRVTATGIYRAAASVESWAEAPFTNVVFRDLNLEYEGGGTIRDAQKPIKGPGVDARPLPAWGFYARNVQNLVLEDVHLSLLKDDLRPALICDRIERLTLDDFKFPRTDGVTEPMVLTNVTKLRVQDSTMGKNPQSR